MLFLYKYHEQLCKLEYIERCACIIKIIPCTQGIVSKDYSRID
jgi:hypothetical protein